MKPLADTLRTGATVSTVAPVIVSASRSTDIPALHAPWFFDRLEKGWLTWRNPFNGKDLHVSLINCRLVVFWSKNPAPLFPLLPKLEQRGISYYLLFTLNDYETEGLEPGVPPLEQRIATFIKFSEYIGKERVIWRYDPLILCNDLKAEDLLKRIHSIGAQIHNHTSKLIFSFLYPDKYQKVNRNLKNQGHTIYPWNLAQKLNFGKTLAELMHSWNLQVATCAEDIDFSAFGIEHGQCIDEQLILKEFSDNHPLCEHLRAQAGRRDRGQRTQCRCFPSKDIGQYNTCSHLCTYCYANTSRLAVERTLLQKGRCGDRIA